MQNIKKYYIYGILNGVINFLLSGSVLQTVLLESGYGENTVNIFISIMQVVQILTILLFSKQADTLQCIKIPYAKSHLLQIPVAIFILLLCFFRSNSLLLIFLGAAAICFNIALGINNTLVYKLPYKIMPISIYGKTVSLSGMFTSIVCLALSFFLLLLQKNFGYFNVMSIAYIISIALPLLCFGVMRSFTEEDIESSNTTETSNKRLNFFKYKPFSQLIFANLTRGFFLGIIGMAVTTGYYTQLLTAESASYLIIIANAVNIFGALVYAFISGKISEKYLLLFSSIAVFLTMPSMLLGKSTFTFLLFYGIAYFFTIIINHAVPVSVLKIANYEIMGQYSAGRMLIQTLGTSLAGFTCIPLFNLLGPTLTIVISAALQLYSGICYYTYLKKNVK